MIHVVSSEKSPNTLVLLLNISALYYGKLPTFLVQNYKRKLKFTSFYALFCL